VWRSERRLAGIVIGGVLLFVSSSAFGETSGSQVEEGSPSGRTLAPRVVAADEWKRCGKIPANPRGHFAVRKKGKVTCRGARKLMRLFLNEGQGVKHGGPSSAETYYTLYGWRCGTGAGGGGCTRRGGRDRTQAYWVA
jgi:hypothetical protein